MRQETTPLYEDEIDLRGYVRALLKYKWWVIGLTLGAVVVALLVGRSTGNGKVYQAESLLVFGQPILNVNNPDTGPQTSATVNITALPDSKGVTDLATTDGVLYAAYQAPELATAREGGLNFGRFKGKMSASLSGTNQLILQAKDPNAKQAVLLVNLWAQAVADQMNSLYGSSSAEVTALDGQTKDALQNWQATEKALTDFLPDSRIDSLSVQLSQAQLAYHSHMNRLQGIELILSDGRALDARLGAQQPAGALTEGDALSLLTLEQRANQVIVCNPLLALTPDVQNPLNLSMAPAVPVTCTVSDPVQLQVSAGSLAAGRTVGDEQAALKTFMDSMKGQQTELTAASDAMSKQLADLRTQLEAAQSQMEQLTLRRDVAKAAYQTVSTELSDTRIEVAANGQVARIVGQAVQANVAPSTRLIVYALVAGALAFIACAVVIYVLEWWRSPEQKEA